MVQFACICMSPVLLYDNSVALKNENEDLWFISMFSWGLGNVKEGLGLWVHAPAVGETKLDKLIRVYFIWRVRDDS